MVDYLGFLWIYLNSCRFSISLVHNFRIDRSAHSKYNCWWILFYFFLLILLRGLVGAWNILYFTAINLKCTLHRITTLTQLPTKSFQCFFFHNFLFPSFITFNIICIIVIVLVCVYSTVFITYILVNLNFNVP